MRVYYICPRSVWEEPIDMGGGMMMPRHNLFDHTVGSSCIHLDDAGEWFLVSTEFANDAAEAMWHSHPEVARLTHPTHQGNIPLAHLHKHQQHGHKQFKPHHWDLLVSKFGLNETHTVWDLHAMATAIDPHCKLASVY